MLFAANGTLNNSLNQHNNSFVIKHGSNNHTSLSAKNNSSNNNQSKSSRSNSAPSSPTLGRSKIRSSISSSSTMNQLSNKTTPSSSSSNDKKQIKKKLAFSDEEKLNGSTKSNRLNRFNIFSSSAKSNNASSSNQNNNENIYEYRNNEIDDKQHKRSRSLTKEAQLKYSYPNQSQTNFSVINNGSAIKSKQLSSHSNYDFRSIYEAFEKPIYEMVKQNHQTGNNQPPISNGTKLQQSEMNRKLSESTHNITNARDQMMHGSVGRNFRLINKDQNGDYEKYQSTKIKNYDTFIDKDKIAAATAAANAAAMAIEKEKEKEKESFMASKSCSNANGLFNQSKSITNFYSISKSQIEKLPVIFF